MYDKTFKCKMKTEIWRQITTTIGFHKQENVDDFLRSRIAIPIFINNKCYMKSITATGIQLWTSSVT